MRKPTLEPVFGKQGTLDRGGAIASALPLPLTKSLRTTGRMQFDRTALTWLAVKVGVLAWLAAIVFVIFGWWPG